MNWIDTHCHLDAAEFGADSLNLAEAAGRDGVGWIVVPAVAPANFSQVAGLAHKDPRCVYGLGIHPVFTPSVDPDQALAALREAATVALATGLDSRLVAIGEIGLDYFIPELTGPDAVRKQEYIFSEQLKLARDLGLPVLLHIRRSQDRVLKYLRRIDVPGGIAHAFNGSMQQASAFIDLGFALGFGGVMTYPRSRQIRQLAVDLPASALVLETDAPDLSPAWRHAQINRPQEIPGIGQILAELRGSTLADIAALTSGNAARVLPRLGQLMQGNTHP